MSNLYWELGAMCVCVEGYKKMVLTYMEASLCVSVCCGLTPRLVCVLCALSAVSLRLCSAIPYCWKVVCLLGSPGRCVGLLLVAVDYPPTYLVRLHNGDDTP